MTPVTQPPLILPAEIRQESRTVSRPRDVLTLLRHNALPTLSAAGLTVLSGHAAVYRLGLCAAVDRTLAGDTVLYLAGANIFDPFLVGRLAHASRVTPHHVLQHIHVSRAFTCHQMVRLVTDCLASAIRRYAARWVILSGPLETLYDESVPDREAVRLFRAMLLALQRLSQQEAHILCVSPLPVTASDVRRGFLATLRAHAHRAIDVRETEEGVRLHERDTAESTGWTIPRSVWNRL
ncbi:MAG: hypothetical protein OEY28_06715 [Nitrospira sp.]|nr:hypothetical protein [Nitrospira sp.]